MRITHSFILAVILIFGVTTLIGSGGSSGGGGGDNSDNSVTDFSMDYYLEKPGDVFTWQYKMDARYSDDNTVSFEFYETDTFSQADTIPSIYSYSGDISGPYTLNTSTEDGKLAGYQYLSADGEEIIDDNLETFTIVDARTTSGDDEPDNVSTGDTFTYHESATLFDSTTGSEVGNEVDDDTFTVGEIEDISISSGTVRALKINAESNTTTTLSGITDTARFSGAMWYDIEKRVIVKAITSFEMTLNKHGVSATGNSEIVLHEYHIADDGRSRSLGKTGISSLNQSSIIKMFRNLNKGILSNL